MTVLNAKFISFDDISQCTIVVRLWRVFGISYGCKQKGCGKRGAAPNGVSTHVSRSIGKNKNKKNQNLCSRYRKNQVTQANPSKPSHYIFVFCSLKIKSRKS